MSVPPDNPAAGSGAAPPPPPPPDAPPPAVAPSQPVPHAPPPPAGYGYGAPGAVPPGMYVDQASGVVLPQGVQLAPVGRRVGAWFLSIALAIVTLFIGYAIWGLIVWGRGQTPALQVLGMRCWKPEQQRVAGWGSMALREIVGRFVEGLLSIITELVSFVMMLTSPKRQCLHDVIAGTIVVLDPDKVLGR